MNNKYKAIILVIMVMLLPLSTQLFAGNRDRSGQAGAQELLIDPWARSAGWGTAGIAEIRGLESIYSNVAGISFVNRLEVAFTRTQYMAGSRTGIGVNAAAITIKLNKKDKKTGDVKDYGVLGLSMFLMNFGKIDITAVDQPEGNLGTFSPNLLYIGVHYAKSFNRYIHGGVTGKIINESCGNMSATGFAFDVGIQYLSGPYENFKIGVTLKNIGLPMHYRGDGLAIRAIATGADHEISLEQRSADCEMPALIALGISYDFLFFGKEYASMTRKELKVEGLSRADAKHRLTLAGSFIANSYSHDQFSLGIEYGLGQIFMVRAGYLIEQGMWNSETSATFYTGPSAGVTVAIPMAKKGNGNQKLFLDYGYRFTNKWGGNHYIGLKLAL
ncbi:MAG: PorV/PorQ family protein [Bacteroidales bacterium]|nr:PorV/PorQ family protein [Bacteroidales bacterium]